MPTTRLSQIQRALSAPASTDTVIGVAGGLVDTQWTLSQLANVSYPLPGDLLTAALTPPVAAHSMARKLFSAYSGFLFRVRRTSDSAVQDIGCASDGWVDINSLNTFLGTSSGTVVTIYDQTGNGNTFTQATAGLQGALTIRNRTDGKAIAVITCTSGQLYRNLTAGPGMPTGANPITVYAVFTNGYASQPCIGFYGDQPLTVADHGSGTIFSVSWGVTGGISGQGQGPWLGVDWENGIFNAATANANTTAPVEVSDYMFVLSKSNGSSRWVLKGGPATTPTLFTIYDGTLPTGYTQNLFGGIALNSGGDGSSGGIEFVEGCICASFTSDASDQAIQTNLFSNWGDTGGLQQTQLGLRTGPLRLNQLSFLPSQGGGFPNNNLPAGAIHFEVPNLPRLGMYQFVGYGNPSMIFYPDTVGQITQLASITTNTGGDGGGYLNSGFAASDIDVIKNPSAAQLFTAMGYSHDIGGGVFYNITYNGRTQANLNLGFFNGDTATFTLGLRIFPAGGGSQSPFFVAATASGGQAGCFARLTTDGATTRVAIVLDATDHGVVAFGTGLAAADGFINRQGISGQLGMGTTSTGTDGQLFVRYISQVGLTTTVPGLYVRLNTDSNAQNRAVVALDGADNPFLAFGPGGAASDAYVNRQGNSTIGIGNSATATNGQLIAGAFRTSTALVATGGGGGNPTLTASSTGGTGQPTTAAQNSWLKMLDSGGNTIWIPVWK